MRLKPTGMTASPRVPLGAFFRSDGQRWTTNLRLISNVRFERKSGLRVALELPVVRLQHMAKRQTKAIRDGLDTLPAESLPRLRIRIDGADFGDTSPS